MNKVLVIRYRKQKSGQILILVLLVVVVALAVGLSVASRNLTNLKTSTQAEQSQRAFTAAEGGVEDVLSKLNTVANVITTGTASSGCSQSVAGQSATCSLQNASTNSGVSGNVTVLASASYQKSVETGDVAQVNLQGASNGTQFTVEWANTSDPSPKASLEFTFICTNDGNSTCGLNVNGTPQSTPKNANAYGQHRVAIRGEGSEISGETGFADCVHESTADGFTCKVTFTLTNTQIVLLRIKPFWNKATIKVTPAGAFPTQTYQITSVATTSTGVSRKVEVTRDALPQLPAVFDYVLYSGQDIIK